MSMPMCLREIFPMARKEKSKSCGRLATDPKILLLDEPAAGMNPHETMSLLEFVRRLNEEKYTIVVIEHDMKFIMNICHRILVLNYGKKICEGTPEHVKNDQKVIQAYFGSKAGCVKERGYGSMLSVENLTVNYGPYFCLEECIDQCK